MAMNCDYCSNYIYDEEEDSYYCDVNLDEDEYYRLVHSDYKLSLIHISTKMHSVSVFRSNTS